MTEMVCLKDVPSSRMNELTDGAHPPKCLFGVVRKTGNFLQFLESHIILLISPPPPIFFSVVIIFLPSLTRTFRSQLLRPCEE